MVGTTDTQVLTNKTLTNPTPSINSAITGIRFTGQHTDSAVTGTTNETTLATLVIPANILGSNGALRITALFSGTGTNTKTHRIKFGGTTFASLSTSSSSTVFGEIVIVNRNATNSQISHPTIGDGSSGSAVVTGSVDTTQSQNVVITGQLNNVADSITLGYVFVEVVK